MRILLVDDAEDVRVLIANLLKHWGYSVAIARNGVEALHMIREHRIQLVISDWMMPEMNGLELCKELRSSELSHYVYLIVLTGKNENQDVVEGLSAGADDFVSKPVNTEILKARVSAAHRIIEMENKLGEKNHLLNHEHKNVKETCVKLETELQEAQKMLGDTEVVVLKTNNKEAVVTN